MGQELLPRCWSGEGKFLLACERTSQRQPCRFVFLFFKLVLF